MDKKVVQVALDLTPTKNINTNKFPNHIKLIENGTVTTLFDEPPESPIKPLPRFSFSEFNNPFAIFAKSSPPLQSIDQQLTTPQGNEEENVKLCCKMCKKNGEPVAIFSSHNLKAKNGKISCPILRKHICELCGATGELAHTKSHCIFYYDCTKRTRKSRDDNKENVWPLYRTLANGKITKYINHK